VDWTIPRKASCVMINYLLPCRRWLSRGVSGAETNAVAARTASNNAQIKSRQGSLHDTALTTDTFSVRLRGLVND